MRSTQGNQFALVGNVEVKLYSIFSESPNLNVAADSDHLATSTSNSEGELRPSRFHISFNFLVSLHG